MNKLLQLRSLRITIVILALTLNFSCKKSSENPPVVTITSPYEQQIFDISNNVNVVATVNASQNLQFVKLALLNASYIAVDNITSFPVSGSQLNINYNYTISNNELPTGVYYITVTAYDGTTLTNGYQPIYIHGINLARKAIYVVTGSNFSNTNVYKIDTGFNVSNVISLSGDFSSSAISSMTQSLYTTGVNSGYFNDINLTTNALNWSVSNPGTGLPYFENVYNYNGITYLGYYNQMIKGFDNNKTVDFTVNTAQNTYPHTMYSNGQFVFAEQRNISANDVRLEVYFAQSSAAFQENMIGQDVVAMFSFSPDTIMIFTNNNGNGNVLYYDINANTAHQAFALPSGMIYSAVQIAVNEYLLAYPTEVKQYFSSGLGHCGSYKTIPASPSMQFDSLNNEIFIANAKQLNVYDNVSSSLIASINLPDTIKDIKILYNK